MKLLHCPFCGGKGQLKKYNESGLWMISCSNNCGVLMTSYCKIPTNDLKIIDKEIKNNVITSWNKRYEERREPLDVCVKLEQINQEIIKENKQ